MDSRRPRSLAELLTHLLALEPRERVDLLRELPASELSAALGFGKPVNCAKAIGWDQATDAPIRCENPGVIRWCAQNVCVGCCDSCACSASEA